MKITFWRILAVLLIGIMILAACGGSSPTASAPTSGGAAKTEGQASGGGNATVGKTKFVQSCAACHGPEGKGVTGLGKDFTTSEFVKSQTDTQLVEFIKKGRPANDPANTTKVEMPAKGGNTSLTDKDLTDVVTYMRTLQK